MILSAIKAFKTKWASSSLFWKHGRRLRCQAYDNEQQYGTIEEHTTQTGQSGLNNTGVIDLK